MADFLGGIGSGISNWWNDVTGTNAAADRERKNAEQSRLDSASNNLIETGLGNTKAGTDYYKNWLTNPSGAYNATMGNAQNIGGALGGMATNNAVNAARGSGLNAGQAALAGGAQSANAFTQGTLGAQQQLMGQGNTAASGAANVGTAQTAQGTGTLATSTGLSQNQQQYSQDQTSKAQAGLAQGVQSAFKPTP